MTIRVLVNGARGKMGQLAVKAIAADPALVLAGEAGRGDDLAHMITAMRAAVVVDLTAADCVQQNLHTILMAGAHAVIGTSGLTQIQIETIARTFTEKQNKKISGLIVPNFSLGAVLMMKYARDIVRYFPDAEIIEMHHDKKIDSPSGTALRTAELMAAVRQLSGAGQIPEKNIKTREVIPHARGACHAGIPVHAVRLPGLLAHQQIIFGAEGETLTLRHDTIDRACFMRGILLACKKVMTVEGLVIGLEQVL